MPVGKADQADTAEVLRLQEVLRQRHQDLAGLGEDDAGRRPQIAKVFSATNELLNFEARLPLLRDERLRRISSIVVYIATALTAVATLAEVTLMMRGQVSWWYVIPVAVVAAAAAIVAGTEHGAPTRGHRKRAAAAVLVTIAAGIVIVVTTHVLKPWALLFVVLILFVAAGLWVSDADLEETR
uniref:hypothetical protein n=1 Tax=Actinoplanes sp. CA-151224 TaxID=3239904 RepID=UPI003F495A95